MTQQQQQFADVRIDLHGVWHPSGARGASLAKIVSTGVLAHLIHECGMAQVRAVAARTCVRGTVTAGGPYTDDGETARLHLAVGIQAMDDGPDLRDKAVQRIVVKTMRSIAHWSESLLTLPDQGLPWSSVMADVSFVGEAKWTFAQPYKGSGDNPKRGATWVADVFQIVLDRTRLDAACSH
jgi:hypothetical protein